MATSNPGTIEVKDQEGGRLHATWSRSQKRLLLSVDKGGVWAQVELRPEQVELLGRFFTAGPQR